MQSGQTKKQSLIESCTNIAIGFAINYTANMLIFPLFGMKISHSANFLLGIIYTAISLARSYLIRRYFSSKGQR